MTRRNLLSAASIAAPMLNFGPCQLYGAPGRSYPIRVVDLVARSLVIDMLGLLTMDWEKLDRWQSHPSSFSVQDFEQARRSGIDVLHPAVDLGAGDTHLRTLEWLRRWSTFIREHPDQLCAVHTCSDLLIAKKSNRFGILMGMQNSEHFRTAADVAFFYEEGQRVSQITYNRMNRLGSGCVDRHDRGLSAFGGEIVRAMNEAGMIVDVSHASERTTLDTIEHSRSPVLITHANCRALVQHPRCKSDTVIRSLARKGGVMGITSVRAFLSRNGKATKEDALDHFDHVARLVGVEHLGIGSDAGVDGLKAAPHLDVAGIHHPQRVFDFAEGLVQRRYSDDAIEGILGGNFQRVLKGVLCA